MIFNWTRPINIPYPNVWLKFKAKDVLTDDLVEYTVEDLPEERFDEAIEIMAKGFLADVPLAKLKNGANDMEYVEDVTRIWKGIVKQKMSHACFKEGSEEIVGLNMNYVSSTDDVSFLDDNVINYSFYRGIVLTYVYCSLKVQNFDTT